MGVTLSRRGRAGALAIAALAVVVLVSTAAAGPAGDPKTFTGCLVAGDGVIVKVKQGDQPKSACTSGQTLARLSGGDITKISVTGGLTLTNGGESGDVEINLDAKYSLPQSCKAFEIAQWNSSSSTWVCTKLDTGTGLQLSQIQLSSGNTITYGIDPDYRVKNVPDCPNGEFAQGFDSSGASIGEIQCAAPPAATLPASSGPQTNFDTGVGIPDDGAFHVMASVNVQAGNYFVTAKGQITSQGNVDDFSATECRIQSGAVVYDSMRWGSVTIDDNPSTTLALAGLGATGGATIELACAADEGADGVGLRYGRLVVMKVS